MKSMLTMLASLALLLILSTSLSARTVTLTAQDCDQMAAISAFAPRLSWVMVKSGPGVFNCQPQLQWDGKMAILLRFPFAELIPKGQRITKAEFTIVPTYLAGGVPEVHVRRILAEWGTGVCHLYRQTYPEKLEWAQPGGRGASTDRASKDSAVFKFAKIGEQTVDLTEDVELWYTGAAANRGWIMTLEPDGAHIYLTSPYTLPHIGGGKHWKLQVTFEPQ